MNKYQGILISNLVPCTKCRSINVCLFLPDFVIIELIGSTSLHNTHQFELTDVSVYVSDTDGTTIGSVTVSMQPTCDTLV